MPDPSNNRDGSGSNLREKKKGNKNEVSKIAGDVWEFGRRHGRKKYLAPPAVSVPVVPLFGVKFARKVVHRLRALAGFGSQESARGVVGWSVQLKLFITRPGRVLVH